MDFKNILLIIVAIANLIIGIRVYCCDPQKKLNQAYLLFSLGIIAWTAALVFFRLASTPVAALQWARILYLAPIGIVLSFVYFCSLGIYSDNSLDFKEKLFWLAPSILMLIIVPWPHILLREIIIIPSQEKMFSFGWGYILYSVYIPLFFLWGYWLLYKRFYCQSKLLEKKQFKILLSGLVLASMGGMTTNLFLVSLGITDYIWMGPLFTFFMLYLVNYGMRKYFLMHSKATAVAILKE